MATDQQAQTGVPLELLGDARSMTAVNILCRLVYFEELLLPKVLNMKLTQNSILMRGEHHYRFFAL